MNHLTGHIPHPMRLVSVNFPNGQSRTRNCTHTHYPEDRANFNFNNWNRNVISGRATNAEFKSNQFIQPIQPNPERWDMFITISVMVIAAVVLVGLMLMK